MSSNKTEQLFSYKLSSESIKELNFAGIDINALEVIKNYQGPVFIYKMALIQKRLNWIKEWTTPHRLHFAMKSNYSETVLKFMLKNGAGVDVVSFGEIQLALKVGFKPQDIVFSGVGKTEKEISWAIENKVYQINVESVQELRRIKKISQKLNLKASVGLRINPEVDAKTHPNIATALIDSKFGLSMEDLESVRRILADCPQIELKSFSFHLGSQIQDVEVIREALQKLKPMYVDWKKQFLSLDRFDLGGGLGIDYRQHDDNVDYAQWKKLKQVYEEELVGLSAFYLLELGRFIVARSAILISQVQYIKQTKNKKMIIIDVGMNNLIRPMLYEAYHKMYPLINRGGEEHYSLVGPLCESSDVFHDDIVLSTLEEGDYLAILDAGAYAKSMSSNYNLQPIAEDYFFD